MSENKNSKARISANNRYNEKAYDRMNIAIPKGTKAVVEQYAKSKGESVNALVGRLLVREMGLTTEVWKRGSDEAVEDYTRRLINKLPL